jgi:hypothetical protein
MNNDTITAFILGGVAGWLIASQRAARAFDRIVDQTDPDRQLPPTPTPTPAPLGEVQDFSPFWADVDFETQIYPAGADETRVRPPSPQGLVASESCDVIALATAWWDAVGLWSADAAFGQTDGDAVSRRVIRKFLPESCHRARTSAAAAIRAEIRERLGALNPDLVFTGSPGDAIA